MNQAEDFFFPVLEVNYISGSSITILQCDVES